RFRMVRRSRAEVFRSGRSTLGGPGHGRSVGQADGDSVQEHGQDHHGEPGFEPEADIDPAQGLVHRQTESAGTDHPGDDDHGQRQHDHLVHAAHDGRQRQRQLDLPQNAPWRRPEGLPGLDHFLVHLPDAQLGEPDTGRDGEHDGGDQPGYGAGEEDDHGGDQIDEGWHRLQEVQDGAHDGRNSFVPGSPDTDRNSDHKCDHGGDDHERQTLHRIVPLSDTLDDEETDQGAQAEFPAFGEECQDRQYQGDYQEWGVAQDEHEAAVDRFENELDAVEDHGERCGDPVDDGGDPVPER